MAKNMQDDNLGWDRLICQVNVAFYQPSYTLYDLLIILKLYLHFLLRRAYGSNSNFGWRVPMKKGAGFELMDQVTPVANGLSHAFQKDFS